jgi:peptidoglycan/xylan/chitin deacetylase (PgdA/CDA1 family)
MPPWSAKTRGLRLRLKQAIIRTGLEALYFSGSHLWLRPFVGGVGAILTLHHVRPPRRDGFQPNRLLEVTPQFLEAAIKTIRRSGIELVSLDEMHRRVTTGDFARRFACLTFDDGYRDTLRLAYPILRRHGVPFAVYIPTSFPDRLGELWWLALEAVIARKDRLGLVIDDEDRRFDCRTVEEKQDLFDELYWWLRGRESEEELRHVVRDLAARYGVELRAFCDELCMSWAEIAELAADPLVTIGAHTVNHCMLKKLGDEAARSEMRESAAVLEAALGARPQHFSYPFGDPTSAGPREFATAGELGFKTAVTTRPGVLFAEHREHLMALPRISLNGEYQQRRFVRVLLSGAGTAVWNGLRRIDAA